MSTALYRRYRPDSFADVIGQEHVTGPLMQALRSSRVNHAYLFSGPRGCGKTTSARILARILNCARNTPENPSDTPCGECDSCVDLATGGSGSLDVVEIDAASHGGVDDARELRERATFSPSRDRYKIFILDEAHMVTPQGFNALLKIVEEPPEYLKFIFATTEPDKVIGTIRSRTHHYPFRLVPPDVLQPYLDQLCRSEGVTVGSGVLPLVVRAGGGSVRDSLSVMDQLIAGSHDGTVDYELAVNLLGYTHATLLDDAVEAMAARDGGSLFRVVERVITSGHEPRRFVEDLLERLRDLIVITVSGESANAVLRDVPADQLARMQAQAGNLGTAELSRAADLVNDALTEMTGATSPRLHLELLCARLLLPAADDGARGLAARLDRLERGAAGTPNLAAPPRYEAAVPAAPAGPRPAAAGVRTPEPERPTPVAVVEGPAVPAGPATRLTPEPVVPPAAEAEVTPVARIEQEAPPASAAPREPAPADAPATASARAAASGPSAASTAAPAAQPTAAPAVEPVAPPVSGPTPAAELAGASAPGASGTPDTEMLRRRWPEVLDTLSRVKRTTWALVGPNSQVVELTDSTLRLSFTSPGLATAFRGGPHAQMVQQAVRETLGFDVRVEGSVDERRGGAPGPAAAPAPAAASAPARVSAQSAVPAQTRQAAPQADPPAAAPAPAPAPAPSAGRDARAVTSPPWDVDEPEEDPGPANHAWSDEPVSHEVRPEPTPARQPDAAPARQPDAAPARQADAAPARPADASPRQPAAVPERPSAPERPAAAERPSAPERASAAEPVVAPEDVTWEVAPLGSARQPAPEGPSEAHGPASGPAPVSPSTTGASTGAATGVAAARLAATRASAPSAPSAPHAAARGAAAPPHGGDVEPPYDPEEEPPYDEDSVPFVEHTLQGVPLVAQLLGGTVIDEIIDPGA